MEAVPATPRGDPRPPVQGRQFEAVRLRLGVPALTASYSRRDERGPTNAVCTCTSRIQEDH